MDVHFVTGNKAKFEEAAYIFRDLTPAFVLPVYTPLEKIIELQGTPHDIAVYKVEQAFAQLNAPCIVDDISLHFPAIGNLPGPYIRQFLEAIQAKGLWELISNYQDRRFFVTCTIGYMYEADTAPLIFQANLEAVACEPKGTTHHGPFSWNSIAYLPEKNKTLAELSLEEISHISARRKALKKLHTYLQKVHKS